jgi:multicomponent Na+:H+ antiporter subunit C
VLLETCILVGVLVACAVYLILQAGFVRILFGFVLLSNAINLLVLLVSGDPSGRAEPIVRPAAGPDTMVDPLPQALVLTAIVIGFGVIAYLVMLLYRTYHDEGTASVAELFGHGDDRAGQGEEKKGGGDR